MLQSQFVLQCKYVQPAVGLRLLKPRSLGVSNEQMLLKISVIGMEQFRVSLGIQAQSCERGQSTPWTTILFQSVQLSRYGFFW